MTTAHLPALEYYFYGNICVCPTVREVMTIKMIKKEHRPGPTDNYGILYKARPASDLIKKFKGYYFLRRELAVDKAMIGFHLNTIIT
jgi:hypothetical protein